MADRRWLAGIAAAVALMLLPLGVMAWLAAQPGYILDSWAGFVRALPAPPAGQPWRQALRVDGDCLARIDVLLTPGASRDANGAVSLRALRGGRILGTSLVEERAIGEGRFSSVEFPPDCAGVGQTYVLEVGAVPGRPAIGVWSDPQGGDNAVSLTGFERADGVLTYRTYLLQPDNLLARLPADKPPVFDGWFFPGLIVAYMVLTFACLLVLLAPWQQTPIHEMRGPGADDRR